MRLLALLGLYIPFLGATLSAAEISVVGGLTREATVRPGETTGGSLLVRNNADEPTTVRAYVRDYLFYADGTNLYGDPGSTPRSNARWLKFSPEQFTIQPGDALAVRYTMDVPDDSTLTGTYWSILLVERVGVALAEPEAGRTPQAGVRVVVRYGIQLVTHIGDTGARAISFIDKRVITQDGKRVLRLDIENTGERWVNPLVWVELFGEDGLSVGRLQAGRKRMFAGCSARFDVDLSELPAGGYSALIVADNGDDHVFGSEQQELDLR